MSALLDLPASARLPEPAPHPSRRFLPSPPDEATKYSYLGKQRRWPFVWIFVAQGTLVYAYAMVMRHSIATSLGLVLLTFTVPPLVVNFWLRIRRRRVSLDLCLGTVEHDLSYCLEKRSGRRSCNAVNTRLR